MKKTTLFNIGMVVGLAWLTFSIVMLDLLGPAKWALFIINILIAFPVGMFSKWLATKVKE